MFFDTQLIESILKCAACKFSSLVVDDVDRSRITCQPCILKCYCDMATGFMRQAKEFGEVGYCVDYRQCIESYRVVVPWNIDFPGPH